ncbi:hypothetical protein HOY82DRAFT_635013 [Tuber indicum]|nr:hypothetical protein HOY82DRAFT_635013 [Tuber indicum]
MIKSPSFVLRKVCEIREQTKGYRYCARTVLCRVICPKGISQLPDRKRTCQFHKYPVDTLAPSICAFVGFGIKVSAYRFWICEQGLYRVQALGHYRTGARVERAKQVAILRAQNASQGLARAGVIRFDKVQFNQYRYHCTIYGNSVRFLASAEGARGRQSKREAREIHTGEEEKKEGLFASSVSGRFRRHCLDSQSTTVVKQQRGSRASGVQSDRGKHRGAPVGNSGEVPALSCLSYPTARERVEASSKQASSLHFSLLLPKFIRHTPFELVGSFI